MVLPAQYARAKANLLGDPSVCPENRALSADFLAFEEHKLKRQNGLPALDDGCRKTLYGYLQRLRNVNLWFGNKPWRDLTREDIQRVYDALEDGLILTRKGRPFQDRTSYYNKIFKSKPFQLAGKDQLAREVIQFATPSKKPVRYLTEQSFRRLVSVMANSVHLLLLWLAWDIGENIGTLLQLTKREFMRQTNRHSGEAEYIVSLPAVKLKRTRQSRSEVTLYRETALYADIVLQKVGADDLVFPFCYRSASEMLERAAHRSGATTMPSDQPVRWKDLRSGMACHLLRNGWSRDEVNARLGHTPHSSELDAYINFMALDRSETKRRMAGAGRQVSSLPTTASEAASLTDRPAVSPQPDVSALAFQIQRALSEIDALRQELQRRMKPTPAS